VVDGVSDDPIRWARKQHVLGHQDEIREAVAARRRRIVVEGMTLRLKVEGDTIAVTGERGVFGRIEKVRYGRSKIAMLREMT